MKIIEKIRTKLIQFLLIDSMEQHLLEEIKRLETESDKLCKSLLFTKQAIERDKNAIRANQKDIEVLQNTIQNVVSVGADVVPCSNGRSWAVICIEGNCNVVKFIDLYGADYHYILEFLKQFEGSRMVVDAPMHDMKYFTELFNKK